MLFLAVVMMPFCYISRTHSVPGYLRLRFGEPSRALSAISFAFMTVFMSGVNMFAMAKVRQIVLGWDINFSIWVSSLSTVDLPRCWKNRRRRLGHFLPMQDGTRSAATS